MLQHKFIQFIIDTCKFERYLEIGTAPGADCFKKIRCKIKIGCDPVVSTGPVDAGMVYGLTSDDFFKINTMTFQISYIDGMHLYEYVIRDIVNSWNCLDLGGFIICHDCIPYDETAASRELLNPNWAWNGDVYRSILWFKDTYPDIPCFVVTTDYGFGLIYKNKDTKLSENCDNILSYLEYDYHWLQNNMDKLNLITEENAHKFIQNASCQNIN